MSEERIAFLNQRVNELTKERDGKHASLKALRVEKTALAEELESLKQQNAKLASDLEGLKAKADAPSAELAAENAKLKATIRQRDHKDAFKARAIEKGVNPARVDALYKLSDLSPPDEGEITAEAFDQFLGEARASHDWAFSPSGGKPTGPSGASQGTATAGLGRSASGTTATTVRYTMADVQKPGWQQANPALAQALSEGRAVLGE